MAVTYSKVANEKPIRVSDPNARAFTSAYNAYVDGITKAKNDANSAISFSYDSLIKQVLDQKNGVNATADVGFKDTYKNARVSAIGNNEVLASKGLAGALNNSPTSGYSESSRIAADTQMQNGFSNVRLVRDSALHNIDMESNRLHNEKLGKLAENESSFSKMLADANYKMVQDKIAQGNIDREFNHMVSNDEIKQSNWNKEYNRDIENDLISQSNKDRDFERDVNNDKISQDNYSKEWDYKKYLDTLNYNYKKEQDKIKQDSLNNQQATEQKNYIAEQKQKQDNFTKELALKQQANANKNKKSSKVYVNSKVNTKTGKASTSKANDGYTIPYTKEELEKSQDTLIRGEALSFVDELKKPWNFPDTFARANFIQNLFEGRRINRNEYEYMIKYFDISPNYLNKNL